MSSTTKKSHQLQGLLSADMPLSARTKVARYVAAKMMLDKVCDQLVILDQRESDLGVRYSRAVKSSLLGSRVSSKLQMAVVTGVKLQYFQYAEKLADLIDKMYVDLTADGLLDQHD